LLSSRNNTSKRNWALGGEERKNEGRIRKEKAAHLSAGSNPALDPNSSASSFRANILLLYLVSLALALTLAWKVKG
jgi:hypothetical protein